MVSLLGEYQFKFPQPVKLEKYVDAFLEKDVDEKYYLKKEKANILLDDLEDKGIKLNERR